MRCRANNIEELDNIVRNGGDIYNVSSKQTQQDTIANLQHTSVNFIKKDLLYRTLTGVSLKDTITTKISRKYKNNKSEGLDTRALLGNFVHNLNENILNYLIDITNDKDTIETINHVSNLNWNDVQDVVINKLRPIAEKYQEVRLLLSKDDNSKPNLQLLFEGTKDIFLQIHSKQKYINKRLGTDGKAFITAEQVIVDPKNDIGGTADLIAIYSDNTASVFDFKTKIFNKKYLDENGELMTDDYLNRIDKDKYKAQLASIQRILIKNYGVKQVVQSRIVPIQLSVYYDRDSGQVGKTITKVTYGHKQNPFLVQYAPLPELTGFKDLDEFLTDLEKRIRSYENKIKSDANNRDFYKNKLDDLNRAKQSILVRHSFNDLIRVAKDVLESSEGEKLSTMTLEQLRDTRDQLKSLSLLSTATYEYRESLLANSANKSIVDEIDATIKVLASSVSDRLFEVERELYNKRLTDAVEKLTGYSILDQSGRFMVFNDEGFFGKYFNQLSHFENPVFKAFRNILDEAQLTMREKVEEVIKDVVATDNALRTWMKNNGKDEKWLTDSLIDTNPESPDVDNLHSKLSPEFRKLIKDIKTNKKVSDIVKYYEPSESYKDWFEKQKGEKKEYFDKAYPTKTAKLMYDKWLQNNDLTLATNGKPLYPDAWSSLLNRGKLRLKASEIENNYSKEYKYIQSIPELLNYYNLFEKYNKEFRSILGVDYSSVPNNFIPNIRKSNIDRLLDNGFIKGSADVLNNFIQELNIREDDMLYGEIDPETGTLKRTIPKFFINPLRHADGRLAVGEKSYDLTKSLILFSKMTYNYEQMNKIEALVLTMRDFLSEKGEQVIKRGGKTLTDFVGNELSSKISGKDIESIFKSFVDLYLYGVTVNPISEGSTGRYEKLILQAKQYFTLKSLGLGFIPATGSFLAAKTQAAIEGFKGQIYTKEQYKNSMKFVYSDRDKFHALYAFIDPMDVNYDFFSVDGTKKTHFGDPRERNFVKKYVNSRMLLRSFSAGDEFIDEVILASMAQNFYIDEEGNLMRMRDDEDRKKYENRSVWNLFKYENGEASLNITPEKVRELKKNLRKAAQAAQSKIKGVIPEEDKAYWQTQIIGQVVMHFKSWMPGVMRERFGKTRYNDALQLVEMGRFTAFGQEIYSQEQLSIPMFVKEILLPKLATLLKHIVWYTGKGDTRRIKLSYENWLENNPQYRGVVSFDDFLSAQRAQMKALIIELRILLTMAMLISMLGADFDDDGKKFYQEMWITRKLVAVMAKTNQEISFTYNPAEFANMIKNPVPLSGVLTDAVNILSNTYDETIDMTLGEKFPLPFHKPQTEDKTMPLYYTSKVIPGANQLEKFLEIFSNQSK